MLVVASSSNDSDSVYFNCLLVAMTGILDSSTDL